MRLCNLQCSIVLLISALTAFGHARHSKLPDLVEQKHKFSTTYCEKLQHECDIGLCPKCCVQYRKGCEHAKDEANSDIQNARSEEELEEQIRLMNAQFRGEEGIEKLSRPVILEDGTEITLYRKEDLQEVQDIKSILADGNEVDTPFFGLDVILTVQQARDMLNHSKLAGLERPKRASSYSYSWSTRSRSGAARTGQAASRSSSYSRQSANYGRRGSYGRQSHAYSGHNRNYGGYASDYNQGGMSVGHRTIQKWPRTVHYVYDQEAARNPQTIRTTRSVAGYMNKHTCLNMVHGLPPNCAHGGGARCADNYIVITGGQGGGCSSSLGMTGGAQAIHMGGNCGQFGAGYRQVSQTLGAPASQGCTTFEQPTEVVQQTAMTPSFCSMQRLNNMYCQNSCNQQQNTCWNGGYQNPANCDSCICPPNYSGQHCETPCGTSEPRACPVQPCTEVQCVAPCPTGYTGDTCQTRCGERETTVCPTQPECREVACPPEPECIKVECPPEPECREVKECPPKPRCREVECKKPEPPRPIVTDCQVSSWLAWSHCDRTCGGTCIQYRSRSITHNAYGSGARCPELREERSHTLPDCPVPVHCEVSEWTSWSTCSLSCGGDCQVERHRDIIQRPSNGGHSCSRYGLREVKTLVLEHCPIDCELSDWTEWSQCDKTCDECEVRRYRSVIRYAQFGGKACDDSWFGGGGGALEETKSMPVPLCLVAVDARVSEWSAWSTCSETCGFCTQSRTRDCLEEAVLGGKRCNTYLMDEERQHDMGICPEPINCEVSQWSEWTECLQTCGICERVRSRQIVRNAENGGIPCSDLEYRLAESRSENLGECQRKNCCVNNWSEWSGCSNTCGTCRVIRNRSITDYPRNGGRPCPRKMVESATIRQRECPNVEWQPKSENNI